MTDPTSNMTYEDWVEIGESEFVDIATGEITDKIGFVFDHPKIGLHGFEYHPENYHIRAVSYQQQDND